MTRLEEIPSGSRVAGVDEVGRGCLFGPVFAAAVVLDEVAEQRLWQAGLTDSKKLSAKRRAGLVPLIEQHCLTCFCLCFCIARPPCKNKLKQCM